MSDVTEYPSTSATTSGQKDPAERFWHVNRKLIPLKAHFFFFFGSFAGAGPALIMYCTKVGMSMSEVGTLFAVLPLIQFFSKIIFGGLADKYQKHKAAFLISIFCMGFFLFSITYLPMPPDDVQNVTWKPADSATFECLKHTFMNDSLPTEDMQLTVCDRNASNEHFAVLSSATLSCDVTCATSGLQVIATLFCEKDNLNCLSNDRYSFYQTPNMRQSIADFTVVSSSNRKPEVSNSSCVMLRIVSVSFGSNADITGASSFDAQQMNRTTVTTCHLEDTELEVSIPCEAVCLASVKPSEYAPAAANQSRTLQYVWIWATFAISWCAYGTLMTTSDTILLHLLGGRNKDFGKTRLFGSLGWGLMGPVVGFVIDKVSEGLPEKDYAPGLYFYGAFMLVDFLVNIPIKVYIPEKSKKLFMDVIRVFRRPAILLTGFAVFVNGITTGFLWTFLVVFANELSGGMQLIIGLNYAVECFVSEIPFYMVSGWIVTKLGYSHAMTASLFFCGLKTFLYSLVYNAWYILIVSLLHGVTYGLLYVSMATYIGEVSPPGTAATFQGIFQGIYEGIGVAVGNFFGGHAYQNLGGRETFMLFGLVTMGASVIHLAGALILKWIAHRSSSSDSKFQLPSFVSGALQPRDA